MRIATRNGEITLLLERGERHATRVAGQNHVHTIFNAAGRRIYTYVDVGASSSGPHVRIRMPWRVGWNGERIPLMELVESIVAYTLSGDWRRSVRAAS